MRQKTIHPAMQPFLDGKAILINKPFRWTSFDVVRKIRNLTGVAKVGHAGTLDPLATGLLIVCTGAFTKKINNYMAQEKEYTGNFMLGATTPTYDLESLPENEKDVSHLTENEIISCAQSFTGEIEQTPPIHSAIKKDGKPAYIAARKGQDIQLEPRKILIKEFEITQIALPKIYFRVVCSTGTYIRTLASDFGVKLNTGAYLSELCRTRIGNFLLRDAQTMEDFAREMDILKSLAPIPSPNGEG
jgi:tRNA pseudouridine55 synthase